MQAQEATPRPDRSIKGPPLASRSHTLQVLVMLTLNSFLLLLCFYVLPAHLLWRRALKQHAIVTTAREGDEELIATSNIAFDAVVNASAYSTSSTRNIFTAFRLLFTIPLKDVTAVAWIQRSFRSSLAAVVLSQGWFVARFKGWWDEAEAMDRGDRDEVLKRRRIGIAKQMEVRGVAEHTYTRPDIQSKTPRTQNVTLTTFALPLPTLAIFLILVLCGAPVARYVALFCVALPHLLD